MDEYNIAVNNILVECYHNALQMEEALKKNTRTKLSFRDRNVMEYLLEYPQGRSLSDIADYLRLSRPSATEIIKKLEKLGLVVRFKDKSERDDRKKRVVITKKGRFMCALQRQYRNRLVENITAGLNNEEKEAFYKGLEHLSECFDESVVELERKKTDVK